MAYGNWGAWVFRDGEHMGNWEDQTPYGEEGMLAGYEQALSRSSDADRLNPHHAVLGGKEMRLCGYKDWAILYHHMKRVDMSPYLVEVAHLGERVFQGEIDGYRFRAEEKGNRIDLLLIEPDGVTWRSRCGYVYGSGHDDEPSDDAQIEWVENPS